MGNERASGLTIYDITEFPNRMPVLMDNIKLVNPTNDLVLTYQQLFDSRKIGLIDPEAMKWVPNNDTDGHLFIAGAVSGTLSVYKASCQSSYCSAFLNMLGLPMQFWRGVTVE